VSRSAARRPRSNLVVLNALTPEQMLVNFAEKGYRVDIGTVANPQAVAANRAITAVDIANKTITIDGGAVTTASTQLHLPGRQRRKRCEPA
jgi:hypothetical protein